MTYYHPAHSLGIVMPPAFARSALHSGAGTGRAAAEEPVLDSVQAGNQAPAPPPQLLPAAPANAAAFVPAGLPDLTSCRAILWSQPSSNLLDVQILVFLACRTSSSELRCLRCLDSALPGVCSGVVLDEVTARMTQGAVKLLATAQLSQCTSHLRLPKLLKRQPQ